MAFDHYKCQQRTILKDIIWLFLLNFSSKRHQNLVLWAEMSCFLRPFNVNSSQIWWRIEWNEIYIKCNRYQRIWYIMHLVFLNNQIRFEVNQKNKIYWHISAECLVEIQKISAHFVLEQEGISVRCQLPACRQSMLHSKQVWTCWEQGVPVQWNPSFEHVGGGPCAAGDRDSVWGSWGHVQPSPLTKWLTYGHYLKHYLPTTS